MSMGFGMHSVMADTEKTEHFCCSVFSLFKHDLKCTPVKQGKFNKDINFVVEKTKNGWSIHFLLLYYFFIYTSGFWGRFISSTSSFWSGFSTMTVSAHAPSMAFAWMLESFYQLTLITITTTSQPTWSPSMILVNSERQNLIASSRDRPIPFRKRPYCCRPPWRRWWLLRSAVCSCCMHRGKDFLDSWNKSSNKVWVSKACPPMSPPFILSLGKHGQRQLVRKHGQRQLVRNHGQRQLVRKLGRGN